MDFLNILSIFYMIEMAMLSKRITLVTEAWIHGASKDPEVKTDMAAYAGSSNSMLSDIGELNEDKQKNFVKQHAYLMSPGRH